MSTYKLINKTDEEINRFVKNRVDELKRAANPRHEAAKEWNRLYHGYITPRGHRRSSVHVPKTFSTIETIIPRIMTQLMGLPYSPVKVKGRERSDEQGALAVNTLLWWRIQTLKYYRQLDYVLRSTVKFGNGWWQTIPKTTKLKSFKREPDIKFFDTVFSSKITNTTKIVTAPSFRYLPYFHVWGDNMASGTGNDDVYDVAWEFWLREDQVKELQEQKVFRPAELQYNKESGKGKEGYPSTASLIGHDNIEGIAVGSDSIKTLRCYRYETDDYFIVIAPDQDKVLMAIENPYWHQRKTIGCVPYIPVEGSIWSIGAIEHLESLQHELDDKRNQRLDIVNLIINPAMKVLRGSALKEEKDFALWPGRAFRVSRMDELEPFNLQANTGPSEKEEDRIWFNMQDASGVNDFIQGIQSRNELTATEVDYKTKQAANRFVYAFQSMMDYALKDPCDMIMKYDQQFLTDTVAVRVLGEQGDIYPRIGNEAIQGEYDLYTIVDPLREDERIRVRQLVEVGQYLKDSPNVNRPALDRKIVQAMGLDPVELIQQAALNTMFAGATPQGNAAMMRQGPRSELAAYQGVMQPNSAAAL